MQHGHNLMVCQSRSLNVSALNLWMVQKRRKVAVLVVSHFVWVDRVCDSLFVTNITSCEKRRHHTYCGKNLQSLLLSAKIIECVCLCVQTTLSSFLFFFHHKYSLSVFFSQISASIYKRRPITI